jgi:hypothetical protein
MLEVLVKAYSVTPEKTASDGKIHVSGLQYQINIVLPDTRDQG